MILKMADTNGDGRVDYGEFVKIVNHTHHTCTNARANHADLQYHTRVLRRRKQSPTGPITNTDQYNPMP